MTIVRTTRFLFRRLDLPPGFTQSGYFPCLYSNIDIIKFCFWWASLDKSNFSLKRYNVNYHRNFSNKFIKKVSVRICHLVKCFFQLIDQFYFTNFVKLKCHERKTCTSCWKRRKWKVCITSTIFGYAFFFFCFIYK